MFIVYKKKMERTNLKTIFYILPIAFLFLIIIVGLVVGPIFFESEPIPLEMIFLFAAIFATGEFLLLGYKWEDIQKSIVRKVSQGFPVIMIFFSIGVLIGSWIISGVIPMLVYYGIDFINPKFLYVVAFLVPIMFSLLTGTSWGSIATIGVVIVGIAVITKVDLGIIVGAIVGGAYFGDKLSPLSDTTNMASIATGVGLYDHIHSMLFTTIPSMVLTLIAFSALCFIYPPLNNEDTTNVTLTTMESITDMFHFNPILLVPPLLVLTGSVLRKPVVPTMLVSALASCLLALFFQDYSLKDISLSLYKGYDVDMAGWIEHHPENIRLLFNRGGLYELNEAIIFTIMVFIFIGILDMVNAMPFLVKKVFRGITKKSHIILASLLASAFTNAFTSNQHATSFIIGDSFKSEYDRFKIPRKVLSRSIEDYGTMIETLIPWTASTLFVVSTLGVEYSEYVQWQFMSIINMVVAPILAIWGVGCFYNNINLKGK